MSKNNQELDSMEYEFNTASQINEYCRINIVQHNASCHEGYEELELKVELRADLLNKAKHIIGINDTAELIAHAVRLHMGKHNIVS